jgi:pimeloyl-ACP methyl ester carboxylesterase
MKSLFVHNGPVAVHVLDNERESKAPVLLVISGLWESAERAIPVLSGLKSRAIALSLRGRGLSSTPEAGYGLESHLSDIGAVVDQLELKDYCMLGFSRGASYALGWSLEHQQDMRGLILVDQPPMHVKPGPGYVDYWSGLVYLGVPILNFMRRAALEGLEREAEDVDFSARLSGLRTPVAFFAGKNRSAAIPSGVT